MKKFVFLYVGYEESAKDMMEAWSKWFASVGDKMVDSGNPFGAGREVTPGGSKELSVDKAAITGYSIVNAETMDEAEKIAKGCPVVSGVRIYEAMAM